MMHSPAIVMRRPAQRLNGFTWLAAVVGIVLLGGVLLMLDQRGQTLLPGMATQITESEHQIVIATRDIPPGTTITDVMVALITVSAADFAKLESAQPGRAFYTDVSAVIGQTTTSALFWFEPVAPIKLGIVPERCGTTSSGCVATPDGMYTINIPSPILPLEDQGLVAGDRVDVLTSIDNALVLAVRDVLLAGVDDSGVVLAANSWKHSILVWLWQSEPVYVLRRSEGTPAVPPDDTLVEYAFTSPEPLPDDYLFDLIVEVDVANSAGLADAPPSLNDIQYTQRDRTMNFWFTDIERMNVMEPTQVIVRLSQSDAEALDFLLSQDVGLTFLPDASQ